MTEPELRAVVAENIVRFRKLLGLTQAGLAEKLNYSDKSVSKWERGEGMPDVFVLSRLAELFGVSVNDMLRKGPKSRNLPGRVLIALLSTGLVFLVAAVVFFALKMIVPQMDGAWSAFIFALPVSCIVLLIFAMLWWNYWTQGAIVSVLVWTLAISVHVLTGRREVWSIYVVAGILQVLCVLWYLLQGHLRRTKK